MSAGVSDEAVETACEVMHDAYERAAVVHAWETNPASRHQDWADVPEANRATMRDAVRALLGWQAAQPFLQPQVVASRQRITEVLHNERHFGRKCDQVDPRECLHYREAWRDVDVLLAAGVFREPPTREQIVIAIGNALWFEEHPGRTGAEINNVAADAVLALMGGAD